MSGAASANDASALVVAAEPTVGRTLLRPVEQGPSCMARHLLEQTEAGVAGDMSSLPCGRPRRTVRAVRLLGNSKMVVCRKLLFPPDHVKGSAGLSAPGGPKSSWIKERAALREGWPLISARRGMARPSVSLGAAGRARPLVC